VTLPPLIELIPHRPPMLLLDRVLSFSADRVVCAAQPTHASIFLRQGAIPGVVTLEYMAQATAACLALARPGDPAQRGHGLLVAARHFSLGCAEIAVHTELVVVATLSASAGRAANFDCRVDAAADGSKLASAELTVYLVAG